MMIDVTMTSFLADLSNPPKIIVTYLMCKIDIQEGTESFATIDALVL